MARFNQLRIEAAIRGDLEKEVRSQVRVVKQSITSGLRKGTYATRRDMRRQITRGKFRRGKSGAALGDTLIVKPTPRKGSSLTPEMRLFSVARYKAASGRRSQAIDLITIFSESATIEATRGKLLAKPTEHAPMDSSGRRPATPSESGIPLVFIPSGDGGFLIDGRDKSDRPPILYVLFPRARISKRINQERAIAKGIEKIPEFIGQAWDKRAAKRGLV
tara:strand:+ start:2077 stop:2733 length:657 start_codon:yes stop_codon:yes gene_type:complete